MLLYLYLYITQTESDNKFEDSTISKEKQLREITGIG